MPDDILERLQLDPGRRTIGELIQERAAAVHEIRALRGEIHKLMGVRNRGNALSVEALERAEDRAAEPRQLLVRLSDLCDQLAVSRGTIYRWLGEGKFPRPVRIGERAVRWRAADVEAWCGSLDHATY
jgi:prophage regulatory protein